MRRFADGTGRLWEVVVGRESWGAFFAIFIPVEGDAAGIRQTPVPVSSYEEATAALDTMDDDGLRALLERSQPKM